MAQASRGSSLKAHMSVDGLLMEYQMFLVAHPLLDALNKEYGVWSHVTQHCEGLTGNTHLLHCLTVMHFQSQMDFERALFCSWMSILVCKEMQIPLAPSKDIFYAALFQDIGKYAVDSLLTEAHASKASVPVREVAAHSTQYHPFIASQYIEQSGVLPKRVASLIMHHHAREDGTGFPENVFEKQLDYDHQLLIVLNEISDFLDVKGGHNQFASAYPWLKLCSFTHFKNIYTSLVSIFEPYFMLSSDASGVLKEKSKIVSRQTQVAELDHALIYFSGLLVPFADQLEIRALRSKIKHLNMLVSESGVLGVQSLKQALDESNTNILFEMSEVFKGLIAFVSEIKAFLLRILAMPALSGIKEDSEKLMQVVNSTLYALEDQSVFSFRH